MGKRLYDYDENYFYEIDSIDKAYWLGFIMADGYIFNNRLKNNKAESAGLRIRLAESDKHQLEKLNESLDGNIPIRIVKNYGIYENQQNLAEFMLLNKTIYESLSYNLNIHNNQHKSCQEDYPDINPKLYRAFILGLFDGDGCIYVNGKHLEWQIVSSERMCNFVRDVILSYDDTLSFQKISKNNSKKDNSLYRVRTASKKTIKAIYEILYYNKTLRKLSLDRKRERMLKVYNM